MTETAQTPSKAWNPFGSVFTILGILMGTASLISLLQSWTGIEVVIDIAADALSLYRQMLGYLKIGIFDWWTPYLWPDFSMPLWGMDALAVWVLFIASIHRYDTQRRVVWEKDHKASSQVFLWLVIGPALIAFALTVMAGILWLIGWVFTELVDNFWPETWVITPDLLVNIEEWSGWEVLEGWSGWSFIDEWWPLLTLLLSPYLIWLCVKPVDKNKYKKPPNKAERRSETWYEDMMERRERNQRYRDEGTENWARNRYRGLMASAAPLLMTLGFFLWNAIQITPQ